MQPTKGIDMRIVVGILVLLCAGVAYALYVSRDRGTADVAPAADDSTSAQISGAAQTPADKLPETNPFTAETNPFKGYANPFE